MSDIESQNTNTLRPGVSIILCTYNGANKLPKSIAGLAEQRVPETIPWEIIFVDNNSTDNSESISRLSWDKNPNNRNIPFTYLSESRPGKYFALTKGLKIAKYEYFIIVDDDNILHPNYVRLAFELIHKQPHIGAIGSKTEALFEEPTPTIPKWLSTNAERYAIGEQGTKGDVTTRKHLWGAGMVSRTNLYLTFYQKYPSFLVTHSDQNILVAEDTEYCLRLILRGFRLYYEPELVLQHYVPNERLSIEYWHKLNLNIENSFQVIDAYYMATKVYSHKYNTTLKKLRLKILTKVRARIQSGQKKARQKMLLGILFPTSRFSTPLIKDVHSFITDPVLPKND